MAFTDSLSVTPLQKISLQMKAQLEGIAELRTDGEEFRWYLKVSVGVKADFV